eukprot:403339565
MQPSPQRFEFNMHSPSVLPDSYDTVRINLMGTPNSQGSLNAQTNLANQAPTSQNFMQTHAGVFQQPQYSLSQTNQQQIVQLSEQEINGNEDLSHVTFQNQNMQEHQLDQVILQENRAGNLFQQDVPFEAAKTRLQETISKVQNSYAHANDTKLGAFLLLLNLLRACSLLLNIPQAKQEINQDSFHLLPSVFENERSIEKFKGFQSQRILHNSNNFKHETSSVVNFEILVSDLDLVKFGVMESEAICVNQNTDDQ